MLLIFPKLTFRCHCLTSPPESSGFLHHFLKVRSACGHFDNPSFSEGGKLKGIRTDDLDVNHPTARDVGGISINDARKIREWQMEKVKAKLRDIPHTSIYYSHCFQICLQHCDHNQDQATEFAETLNHSGDVIVFGDVVFYAQNRYVS